MDMLIAIEGITHMVMLSYQSGHQQMVAKRDLVQILGIMEWCLNLLMSTKVILLELIFTCQQDIMEKIQHGTRQI